MMSLEHNHNVNNRVDRNERSDIMNVKQLINLKQNRIKNYKELLKTNPGYAVLIKRAENDLKRLYEMN